MTSPRSSLKGPTTTGTGGGGVKKSSSTSVQRTGNNFPTFGILLPLCWKIGHYFITTVTLSFFVAAFAFQYLVVMIKTGKFQNNTENCTLSRTLAELDRHRQKSDSLVEKQIEVSSWWQSDEIFKIIIFCLSKKFLRQFFENPVRTNSQAKGGNYFLIRQRSKRVFF